MPTDSVVGGTIMGETNNPAVRFQTFSTGQNVCPVRLTQSMPMALLESSQAQGKNLLLFCRMITLSSCLLSIYVLYPEIGAALNLEHKSFCFAEGRGYRDLKIIEMSRISSALDGISTSSPCFMEEGGGKV